MTILKEIICIFFLMQFVTPDSVIYLQAVTFASNFAYATRPNGYTLSAVWDTEQTEIVQYSYILNGFQIHTNPNPLLSFDAALSNVTSTSASLTFNPYNNSCINYISFYIVLVKATSGLIDMQYIEYYTSSLNIAGHVADIENVKLFSSVLRAPNGSFTAEAMLSSFHIAYAPTLFKLQLGVYAVDLSEPSQSIQILSDGSWQNVILKVCFTYVLLELQSFNDTIIVQNHKEVINTDYHSMNVDAQFYPNPAKQCMFGINKVMSNFVSRNESTVIYLEGSNNVNFRNSDDNQYSKFCIFSCTKNTFMDPSRSNYTCFPCNQIIINCNTCGSLTTCEQCYQDYFYLAAHKKCYRVCPDGYYGNTTTKTCMGCLMSSVYTMMINGSCTCQNGYTMLDNICTNITGCLTLVYQSYSPVCKFCNVLAGFIDVNGDCQCRSGFSAVGVSCVEICGDGLLFDLQCDDGNTQNGDGCSFQCKIQQDYICSNGSSTNASRCVYVRHDIKLSLKKIDKVDLMNRGIFTFKLSPAIYSMSRLNLTNDVNFSCAQSISIYSISLSNGQLTLFIDFLQDLEGRQANVTIFLEGQYFSQQSAKTSFPMISNGVKLLIIKDQVKMLMCKQSIEIISIIIVCLFVLSFLTHKMIGVEMIHTFQVIYLAHLINGSYTQLYSFVRFLSFSTFDFLMLKNNLSSVTSVHTKISFGESNLQLSIIIITGVSVICIVFFLGTYSIWTLSHQQGKQIVEIVRPKELFTMKWFALYSYSNLVFPFVMSTFFVTFAILSTKDKQSAPLKFSQFCIFQVLVLSMVFFYEIKVIFTQRCLKKPFLGVKHCKKQYLSHYLFFTLVVSLVICAAFQHKRIPFEFILVPFYTLYLVYVIFNLPYSCNVHNVGVIFNALLLIYFLIWSGLKSYYLIDEGEDSEILAFFVLILLIVLCLISTLFRIGREVIKNMESLCKFLQQRNKHHKNIDLLGQINADKQQQIQNAKVRQDEFLMKIAKDNLKDRREIDPSLFIHPKNKEKDSSKQSLKKIMRAKMRERNQTSNQRDALL